MDPVDSTQGRQGRSVHREHHNSVMHVNDHIGNQSNNHGNMHGHLANINQIRSPGNPPVPKRNHPTSHACPFTSTASTASIGAQGKYQLRIRQKTLDFYKNLP